MAGLRVSEVWRHGQVRDSVHHAFAARQLVGFYAIDLKIAAVTASGGVYSDRAERAETSASDVASSLASTSFAGA